MKNFGASTVPAAQLNVLAERKKQLYFSKLNIIKTEYNQNR
ncbi:MAG: hypothetical protein ACI4IF_06840 [Acutalibacteraceae bacterium]